MAFTPFVKPDRSLVNHTGYDESEMGRIHSHVCKVAEKAVSVCNNSTFPIVITIRIYTANPDSTYTSFPIVNRVNVPPSGIYSYEPKLTLLPGDYLTVQALDQKQIGCTYTTALFWDELMMT